MNPIKKLRQMLNQEVNSLTFNPDIRGKMPEDLILCIRFGDNSIHCVMPENPEFGEAVIKFVADHYGKKVYVMDELDEIK